MLEKCPDKNAKLTFDLTAYMKEEITADKVSQASKAPNVEALPVENMQPNFKKKKKDESVDSKEKQISKNKSERNILPVAKENIPKLQYLALEEESRKLK